MQEESVQINLKPKVQGMQEVPTVPYHTVMTPEFIQSYRAALSFSNLQLQNELRYRNVLIHEDEHIHELYTVSPHHLPHLVMLHGFGGTSLTFIRLFHQLKDHFQVHALDTFGIGLSSRGKWKAELTPEETVAYFVQSLQEWRKNVGIDKFNLLGHSFGGHIASLYYGTYPTYVSRLILLSPVGSGKLSQDQIDARFQNRKFFYCFAEKLFNLSIRPSKIMNAFFIGSRFTERILTNRLKLPEQQKQVWKDYLKKINDIENSSEPAFYTLFSWPLQPHRPIDETLRRVPHKTKVHFLFGDNDWMSKQGVPKLIEEFDHIDMHIVPDAGHQMIFDNPEGVANKIIDLCHED